MFGMKNIRTIPQLLVRIFIRPLFPFLQGALISSGMMVPPDRQPFLLGKLSVSKEGGVAYLKTQGFFDNRIAWPDPGQTVSMRRLCDEKNGWQYHIRFFEDGEIRGHYERTPEDFPWQHLKGKGLEDRKEKFLEWISPILN